ncbi:MAG TPA: hypothetical protein VD789_06140 [Thermomicrobiales bacterium]|nr:hypothetical protein [Thermomicrobiales bacterium]
MYNLDAMFAVAEARRHELRALAKPQPFLPVLDPNAGSLRQRLGRAMIRLGRWLDDHYPEPFVQTEVPTS